MPKSLMGARLARDPDFRRTPVHAPSPEDSTLEFATATLIGLDDRPRWLPCRFLYDEAGSRLFEAICATPEYYLTRTEAGILAEAAGTIADLTGPVTLVELGSGNSVKTGHLLRAYARLTPTPTYVPVDVSDTALDQAKRGISASHPSVRVRGVHGRYEAAFPLLRTLSPGMLIFLGSTIGNLNQTETLEFWTGATRHLASGDFVLLGADLVKDPAVIDAAYNDAAGHSAAFTKNLFARMNRELGATVDLSALTHEARYVPSWQRVEIYARVIRDQTLHVRPLDRTVRLEAGERIMTEISRKFVVEDLVHYLSSFGLEVRRVFSDERKWYAVLLLQKQ